MTPPVKLGSYYDRIESLYYRMAAAITGEPMTDIIKSGTHYDRVEEWLNTIADGLEAGSGGGGDTTGTPSPTWQLDNTASGVILQNLEGELLEIKNGVDANYAVVRAGSLALQNSLIVMQATGSDFPSLFVERPSASGARIRWNNTLVRWEAGIDTNMQPIALGGGGSTPARLTYAYEGSPSGGGGITAGAWSTCPWNVEVLDSDGIGSLSSNVITIPAGTYDCTILRNFRYISYTLLRLWNVTAGAAIGTVRCLPGESFYNQTIHGMGRFTVTETTQIRVEYLTDSDSPGDSTSAAQGSVVLASAPSEITYGLIDLIKVA